MVKKDSRRFPKRSPELQISADAKIIFDFLVFLVFPYSIFFGNVLYFNMYN